MDVQYPPVVAPPHKSSLQKFKVKLKETLFPDDPMRQFKGQPFGTKIVLAAQYVFPILQWLPQYSLKLFKSDIISGITIASLSIPQGISYAKLAGLPPSFGLYSSFVPPLVYAVLGSSKDLAIGPAAITSLVLRSMLTQGVSATSQPQLFLQLAFTSTLFAGVFHAALGILRLGFIIDFLSKAILVGFMAGVAVIVSLQQLKSLLGITHFTKKMTIVDVLSSVFSNIHEWSWQTIVMGAGFLILLLLARQFSLKKPKYFWVSAGAPLLSVITSTAILFAIRGKHPAILVIGKLPEGVNPPSVKMLYFEATHLGLAIKTGIIVGILSLTESIAVGRTFAAIRKYKVDGNKEMIAIGLMNVIGSTTSCFASTGSFSRTAVNHNAGAKTAMSNIVMSVAVLVTLLFLMPLLHYTPHVVLGAIIVTAVIGFVDIPAAYRIWKIDKFDFVVMLTAFFGVIFISVEYGLALAVGLSILRILLQITRPKTVMLGNIPGTRLYRDLHHYNQATRIPGFLILSIEAPINFANITYLQQRTLRWIEEEEESMKDNSVFRFVILEMSAVSNIDTSGVSLFQELKSALETKHIKLALVNPLAEVIEKLTKADESDSFIREDYLFLSVGEAVGKLSSIMENSPSVTMQQEQPPYMSPPTELPVESPEYSNNV
ncbi:putative sulfate transporter 3 [Arachis hypogaea]|nr:putative sulfate transporter 3 [Arachis hypogaea]